MSQTVSRDLVSLIGQRFISRKDVKAIQRSDGSWNPVREGKKKDAKPIGWKMADFEQHLRGDATFGHYTVATNGMTRFFAFDIDLRKFDDGEGNGDGPKRATGRPTLLDRHSKTPIDPRAVWAEGQADKTPTHGSAGTNAYVDLMIQMRCLAEGLAYGLHRLYGFHVAVAYSGHKGVHVYAFCGEVPADQARAVAIATLQKYRFVQTKGNNFWMHEDAYQCFEIEIFPKQADMNGKEFGNLMSLPLGVNQITGQRKFFMDLRTPYDQEFKELDPMEVLMGRLPWEATGSSSPDVPASAHQQPPEEPAPAREPSEPATPGALWTEPGHPILCPACDSTRVLWKWKPDDKPKKESAKCYDCGWEEKRKFMPVDGTLEQPADAWDPARERNKAARAAKAEMAKGKHPPRGKEQGKPTGRRTRKSKTDQLLDQMGDEFTLLPQE